MLSLLLALYAASDDPVSFQSDVAPILVRRCLGCHEDRKAEAGLNLATFAKLKKGGREVGEGILEPGDPDASHLIAVIRPDATPRMPFKEAPLSDREIAILERWVSEGARFDGPSESETPLRAMVDPLTLLPRLSARADAVEPVTAVVYTPDGKTLLAARGLDVHVIDLDTRKVTATLAGHDGPIADLHVAPDGTTLVVTGGRAGQFGSIAVWDLARAERRRAVRGHADTILDSALSPDGKTLVTCSYDRAIKLWDVGDGREIRSLKEHTDVVYGVAFSPDGTRLASVAGDRTLKLWDVADGRRLVSLSDATAELYAVAFAADGKLVFAGGVDRTVRGWRLAGESAALALSAFAHDAPIVRLALTPDGATLASASEDRSVKLWDAATLEPRRVISGLADWPLAVAASPDGAALALGLYDGRVAVHKVEDGTPDAELLGKPEPPVATAATPEPPKPELVRNATLDPPTPRGVARGGPVKVRLTGLGVGRSSTVWFPTPAIAARLLPLDPPNPNAIDVELTLPADLPPAVYPFKVRTPLGTAGPRLLAVSAWPETASVEPDDEPAQARAVEATPTTWTGAIDRPGDVDHLGVTIEAGRPFVAGVLARDLGSALAAELTLLGADGEVLARATRSDEGREPVLHFHPERTGPAILRVADTDFGGSGNHFYRVAVGLLARVETVSPLGVTPGTSTPLTLTGDNLDTGTVTLNAPADAAPGTLLPLPPLGANALPTSKPWRVVVAEGLQTLAAKTDDDDPARAAPVATPGGLSGVLETPGDVDHARFQARKAERWIVEVFGRRLGSPIDPFIEIETLDGRAVPRAVVRPVRETTVAFRDHPSTGRNIRLTWPWTGFAQGDHVLIGRELIRLHELPRNPDDDAVLWGLGNPRNNTGERVAALETTPEHHPMGQPIYKVEIHPPGATFPPGGVAPVTVYYRNDDGGPGLEKDARLTFDVPEDGSYVVRIEDSRGLGGREFGYHVVVRPARPDFRAVPEIEDVNIPRGSAVIVPIALTRLDGFDGPVDVSVEGLPEGITATSARVEPDQFTADLLFEATPDAPDLPAGNWTLVARSVSDDASTPVIEHRFDPGGPDRGWITVTPPPNLRLTFAPSAVEIRPGEEVTMTLTVERRNGFSGRVPIDVRNLPYGVRVLDIGLNGVLITEQETERVVRLYAEPWVKPQQRPFFAVANCEAAGTTHPAPPIPLTVLP